MTDWNNGQGGMAQAPFYGSHASTIPERNSAMVLVLTILTCGIYKLYWLYTTSGELAVLTQDQTINPSRDLLLSIVTCGIWSLYVEYRNVQRLHHLLLRFDPQHKDKSETVVILFLASLLVGVSWLFATFLVQEEFNQLSRNLRGQLPPARM